MQKFTAILLSFLSAVTVMAQNDALENITTEVNETIINPQYDFAPDADSPNVEVAPLTVNNKDQDVPLKPEINEKIQVDVTSGQNENSNDE